VDTKAVGRLVEHWRDDAGGTYQSWFLWDQRLKNFRSIRRGLLAVVAEIEAGSFGNAYRGSSLETVIHSIAEQRQIFRGADHAFLAPACAVRRRQDWSRPSMSWIARPSRVSARPPPTFSTSCIRPWRCRSTRPSSTATTRLPAPR